MRSLTYIYAPLQAEICGLNDGSLPLLPLPVRDFAETRPAMNSWRWYWHAIAMLAQQMGAFVGTFMFLLALPGVIVPLASDSGSKDVLPWFSAGVAVVSTLLCALGASLVFFGIRNSLHFGLLARLRGRRGRAR